MVQLTERAVGKVKEIMSSQEPQPGGLRIAVVGGGCSGFSYSMAFENREGFPPTVLHLTDGASTDGHPTSVATDILSRSTSDGHVLLFNCHVSARHSVKIEYPENEALLPDNRARTLFNISSLSPDAFVRAATQFGLKIAPGARGFVFNGDPLSVAQFFEIGTRPANLR